ncbi:MAG: type II secretion system F family protein [Raoultibacter sp.]
MNAATVLPLCAGLFAALSGALLSLSWQRKRAQASYRRKVKEQQLGITLRGDVSGHHKSKGLPETIVGLMQTQSDLIRLRPREIYFTKGIWLANTQKFDKDVLKAGLEGKVTRLGYCHARALLCIGGALVCALFGAVFSTELLVVGVLMGAFMGWRMPAWAVKRQIELRKRDLEDHLSEMLEVISLGLRSGLSFDQSFELYHEHFQTSLGTHAASVQRTWQLGLSNREDALRSFAQAYDSSMFSRVIENVIRSLRFGSSLAESFDSAALEARLIHKAHREEEVAKAPVKMLVPTAALILPAMLLLVLGPVLLEMMQGF